VKLETADAPELVVVVANADAEMLLNALLQRGIERQCLRRFPWKILRDPMRDAAVRREPEKTLRAMHFVRPPKVVIAFDHEGSGIEETKPEVIESEVQMRLTSLGYRGEDVCCIVFAPELEVALVPVWSRCLELLAKRRNRPCPSIPELLKRGQLIPKVDKSPETQWLQQSAVEAVLACAELAQKSVPRMEPVETRLWTALLALGRAVLALFLARCAAQPRASSYVHDGQRFAFDTRPIDVPSNWAHDLES
jgi:hypothetical protein